MIRVTAYEDVALFDDFAAEWRELLDNSDADQIFVTTEWLKTWWRVTQPGQLWVLVCRDDASGQWLGAAPWFIAVEGERRIVHTVGCEEVTDYLDIIARRGAENAVFRALLAELVNTRDRLDEVQLCNIPERSAALRVIPALADEFAWDAVVRPQEPQGVCPQIALPAQFEEYIGGLDKKNRHELRRKLRRASGAVDWYIVGPEHDLAEELQRFLRLMAASSPDKAVFLDNEVNRQFFEEIVPVLAQQGWLQLAFLTVGGEAAAAYLNFVYNNRVLVYNSGHNPELHGHLSPGIVLMGRLIEHAIAEGRDVFDFLRGGEPYKYDLGGRDTHLYELRLLPRANQSVDA